MIDLGVQKVRNVMAFSEKWQFSIVATVSDKGNFVYELAECPRGGIRKMLTFFANRYQNRHHRETNSGYFPEFRPSDVRLLISRNKHAKFGPNRYSRSRDMSEQTNIYTTTSTFYKDGWKQWKEDGRVLMLRLWTVIDPHTC